MRQFETPDIKVAFDTLPLYEAAHSEYMLNKEDREKKEAVTKFAKKLRSCLANHITKTVGRSIPKESETTSYTIRTAAVVIQESYSKMKNKLKVDSIKEKWNEETLAINTRMRYRAWQKKQLEAWWYILEGKGDDPEHLKAVFRYMTDYLRKAKNNNFCYSTQKKHFKNLNRFNEFIVKLMLRTHVAFNLLKTEIHFITALFACFAVGLDSPDGLSIIFNGLPDCGKTYLINLLKLVLIIGSVISVNYESDKVDTYPRNPNDYCKIELREESDPATMIKDCKTGAMSTKTARRAGNMTSSNRTVHRSVRREDSQKIERESTTIESGGISIEGNNIPPNQMHEALLSRFHVSNLSWVLFSLSLSPLYVRLSHTYI
jgi:hypothetical protein